MFDFLADLLDPNHDYNLGKDAGRDAGWIQQILHEVLPFGSEAFEAGYDEGLAEQDEE